MLVRPQRFGDRQRLLDAPRAVFRRPLALYSKRPQSIGFCAGTMEGVQCRE
jgi:hypothetical protein